jgi:aminopeptidase N
MSSRIGRSGLFVSGIVLWGCVAVSWGDTTERPQAAAPSAVPTRADILRGEYGPYRANNDLLSYNLDVRVDPDKKLISGKNTIRFRMLRDDVRIQLDLFANLTVDKILLGATELTYLRELNAVFIDFPQTLRKSRVYSIEFYYSGTPAETGRFGGFTFRKDPAGRHWINTSCQGPGASVWWPNKDQQRDEVEEMRLSVSVPKGLIDASNGKLLGTTDLGDGYVQRVAQHRCLRALQGQAGSAAARLLCSARGSREGETPVRAGEGHA